MPKISKELSALEVSRLTETGRYAVGGVSGLHLEISKSGARSWILRVLVGGKRRDIGLGGYPTVKLAKARDSARDAKEKIAEGIDPVAEKRQLRGALRKAQQLTKTFNECAAAYISAHQHEWSNPKHAQQWENTLDKYASPVIGNLPVNEVDMPLVLQVLEPIWVTKTETATRVRGRLERVLDWAAVHGHREGENPARWRGHLDQVLAKPSKTARINHHPALIYDQIGAFMGDLRGRQGVSASALEFLVLTACRSGEVRGATWDEIDMQKCVWTIPTERMKAGKEHTVPLSSAALEVLRQLPRFERNNLVFVAPRGGQLSDMSLTAVLRRMKPYVDRAGRTVTAHGFRSTFRDWAGETTAYPREVIEHALAHQLKDKAEAAYQRGTLFKKREKLMEDGGCRCSTDDSSGTANVLQLKRGQK